jgi:hypothetical protein
MTCLRTGALAIFSALGLAATANMALAVVVTTNVHGTLECRKTSGLSTSLSSRGMLRNNSTVSSVAIICPVDRDYFNTAPNIWVAVSDNAAAGVITCRAASVNAFGTTESVGAAVTSTGGNQWLVLSQPSANFDTGSYQVRCTIPKRATTESASSINSIWVMEENGL